MTDDQNVKNTNLIPTDGKLPQEKKDILPQKKINESLLSRIFGSRNMDFSAELLRQIQGTQSKIVKRNEQENNALILGILEGIAPQNEIEAMLTAQMLATHNAAMECF